MMDCRLTENYLKARTLMCSKMDCDECEFRNGDCINNYEDVDPNKAIDCVQKWADENMQKTYTEDFTNKFPECVQSNEGIPNFCKGAIYGNCDCIGDCVKCWNEEVSD